MAVKIRLKRMGKIRAPFYRIVVADSRNKRDGRSIEEIGKYHPTEEPSFIEVDSERAQYWLSVGAQPSPQVEAILKLTGDWGIFKGDKNAKSTVKTKDAKVEFQADEKKKPVLKPKAEKPAPVVEAPVEAAVVEAAEAPVAEAPVAEAPVAEVEAAADVDAAAATGDDLAADIAVEDVVSDGAPEEAPAAAAADEAPVAGTDDAPAADEATAPSDEA
ncbi:MAG: ribosomal protein [Rhodoglobus sp.]|nr:ribosomal protein [Rhodoglobus sp.]